MSQRPRAIDIDLADVLDRALRRAELEQPAVRLPTHVPALPLVEVVQGRGGIGACLAGIPHGSRRQALEQAFARAATSGRMKWQMADRLAIELVGLHPMLLWGDQWFGEPHHEMVAG